MVTNRIGIFGGTFDPPHIGHLSVIEGILASGVVDELWIMVAPEPWQKADRQVSSYKKRLDMVKLAIEGLDSRVLVSELEATLDGPTSTYATLQALALQHPQSKFVPIVGADTAAGLDSWRNAIELQASYSFLVVNRPGASATVPDGWRYESIEIEPVDVSSSQIRKMISQGEDVSGLVRPSALTYLRDNS